jgi:hypothetical protein
MFLWNTNFFLGKPIKKGTPKRNNIYLLIYSLILYEKCYKSIFFLDIAILV